ncbi:MAG: SH3 domain-containing protein [Candidatus Obscuribacterales bacterium]|nr:SH3 domain-containing protein [Candidatus Obscuribacterales bacterium]
MRCPECSLRNSVAARSCTSCGHRFKKKPVGKELKIAIAGVVGLGIIWAAGAAIVPQFTDPQQNLTRISKRMMAGPGNANEAKSMRKEFEQAISAYLEKIGGSSSKELTNKLQKLLPSEAFEVHIVELPRGLKVVEVDTMLEASSFLVMKGDRQTKVFPLNGLEVFDDARLLNETAGPLLVLLGHSGGQEAHQPQVRAYALMPDTIADVTEKFIPKVVGEGTARFAKNGRDIQLDLCVLSMGKVDNVISKDTKIETTTAHQNLLWKDAHYVSAIDFASSPLLPLYAVTECLRNPELTPAYKSFLGGKGQELVANYKSPNAGNFLIKKGALGPGKIAYTLSGPTGAFKINVARDSKNNWTIASYASDKIASAAADNEEETIADDVDEKPIQPVAPAPIIVTKKAQPAPVIVTKKAQPAPVVVTKKTTPTPVVAKKPEPKPVIETRRDRKRDLNSIKPIASLKPEPKVVAAPVEIPMASESAYISSSISASTVNIRTAPGTDAKPVAEVGKGTQIEIVGKAGGWYKVRHNGKVGYVYGGLVDYQKPEAYTTATITKGTTVVDHKKKPTVKPQAGDRVIVLGGMKNDKYRVQFPNGKTGYINKDAVNVNIDTPQFVP